MESLKDELNSLIGKYGVRAIHEMLTNRMELDYLYLKRIYEKKEVQKKDEPKNDEPKKEEAQELVSKEEGPVKDEKKHKDPKEVKAWQKEQEEKKRKENESKGVNPKDLLTKENLQKWIIDEGRTFSYIAREYVGCKDSEVSAVAKALGIENTRKNVLIKNFKK